MLCCADLDYEVGSPEQSTELSEDTDCDGSSLPEDSPPQASAFNVMRLVHGKIHS